MPFRPRLLDRHSWVSSCLNDIIAPAASDSGLQRHLLRYFILLSRRPWWEEQMNPEEVARTCDELHECIDQGPGENPGVFAQSLSAVRKLRAAAAWDYPIGILGQVEIQIARWFSPDLWQGEDEGAQARQDLIGNISKLEDAWERPRA
jgi:hypothetical protein